eukprot:TRINITY_DN9824_c0_g1_i10.p1 TRINITY_DN9824_c0_g1~~TRINITY_DN9824_c0_g1_i10.p1  ORF type:complete len:344 (-),score=25.94 TRINITY_DN9824_c0_g1_i10:154-1128(-)
MIMKERKKKEVRKLCENDYERKKKEKFRKISGFKQIIKYRCSKGNFEVLAMIINVKLLRLGNEQWPDFGCEGINYLLRNFSFELYYVIIYWGTMVTFKLGYCSRTGSIRQNPRAVKVYCNLCRQQKGVSQQESKSYERVLRYPDGHERRIRYPVVEGEVVDPQVSGYTTQDFFREIQYVQQEAIENVVQEENSVIPNTPLQLFRALNSVEARRDRKERLQKVQNCYDVLIGCPWVTPRPVYVLSLVGDEQQENGQTYTLRTRLKQNSATIEMALLFRKSSSAQFIDVSEMRDGVVLFETIEKPIAHKYCEGKMKRTLERELKSA